MKTILIPDKSTDSYTEKKVFGDAYKIVTPNENNISHINEDILKSCIGVLAWHNFIYTKEACKIYKFILLFDRMNYYL